MTPFTTDNPDILDLQPRLQHADPGVRRIALIELADLEEPEALPWLARALTIDPAAAVRAEAARLLEAWEEPEVVQALCQALADSDETVREAAAQSLSELKTAEAGRLLLPRGFHRQLRRRIGAAGQRRAAAGRQQGDAEAKT